MKNNKIINGLVYRIGDTIILLSFFTEKLHAITDDKYFTIDKGEPLPETSIVLVNYEEIGKKQFLTHPIVEYVLEMDVKGKSTKINAGFLSTDTIIRYAFKAAQRFVENRKTKELIQSEVDN